MAAVAPDLVDFTLMLRYPGGAGFWAHSLAAMFTYAVLFFLGYVLATRNSAGALLLGLVAGSHVLLDLITSRMVLFPGGPPLGLHLYRHRFLDLGLESTVILLGWLLYVRTLPRPRRFSAASLAIPLLLLVMQSLMATMNVL